jgi:DNA-binding GntR family transcriptional regulator
MNGTKKIDVLDCLLGLLEADGLVRRERRGGVSVWHFTPAGARLHAAEKERIGMAILKKLPAEQLTKN